MPADERDKNTLYESLLRQGVSKEQIQRVHRDLREKGYGEEETRRRSLAALERLKSQKVKERRAPLAPSALPRATSPAQTAPVQKPTAETGKRAIDWLPEVPPWLRRRIGRYAYRNGFLITRLLERVEDFLSIFDPAREDFVSFAFMRLLAERRRHEEGNPFALSFIDTLDALRDCARTFLGKDSLGLEPTDEGAGEERGDEVVKLLRSREPFALEFFGEFTEPWEMLRKSLAFVDAKLSEGTRARVSETARVVKDGCRLILMTEAIEKDKLETLFDIIRETNLFLHPGEEEAVALAQAEGLFRAAYQNLRRFNHELYPALLKMIASFYEENDTDPEKRQRVLAFLGLREEQILTWEGWQRKVREEKERALAEEKAKELERLEREKAEKFSTQFEGTLATLCAIFPDSGMERVDQGEHTLPYFVNRVFTRTALFQSRLADLEHLSASDALGQIMVFHSILDDLLSSVEPYALEKALGRETLAGELITLRGLWAEAYKRLFDPYLDEIREFAREMEGDPRYVRIFRESQRERGIEERINRLRNRMIRNFGHVVGEADHYEGPRLYELAARLVETLADVGQLINQDLLAAEDPVRRMVAAELGTHLLVDYIARSRTSSPDYRPVTRQIRRWVEARFHESVVDIPQKAQVAFIDVFRGIAEMYNYLLNDPKSFAAASGHGVVLASATESERWVRERGARGRSSLDTLQATLKEEFPGRYVDSLTGLQNKEYFLNELPKKIARIRVQGKPLTLLMIDIDHFKWVNDELGHTRGDEVLKSTGQVILDNIREGDLAVRYGGEELLVLIPSDLHTGIILAERLRHAQEQGVRGREAMRDVQELAGASGDPCGTLSVGVADVTNSPDLARAVEKSDKALYFAKRSRNTVAFLDPAREEALEEPFTTYTEYRERAGRAAW